MLIVNPASGKGRARKAIPRVLELAAGLGLELAVHETSGPGSASEAARTAPEGVDRLLVIGGDGTVNEVVNGLGERVAAGGGALPVALIPTGTSNSAARELGVPFDLDGAVAIAAGGDMRQIDLGVANGRRFFLCAGTGPGAYIVTELHRRRTGAITTFRYYRHGVRCFLFYGFPLAKVTVDGRPAGEPARMVVVTNMSHYGHPLKLVPDAKLDDGLLDVCIIRLRSRWSCLGVLWAMWRHRLEQRTDVEVLRVKTVRIEPADPSRPLPLQVDGDPGGELPVEISVLERAQGFFVSPAPDSGPAP